MKKVFQFLSMAVIILTVASCGGNSPSREQGVVINGVRWATRNVDAPGTFAASPESAGMFYQWNRKVGWSSTDPMVNSDGGATWDSSIPSGTEWIAENDPCPEGWRVPTKAELESLLKASSVWTTQNGVKGRLFGTAPNTVFLPAAGYRHYSKGELNDVGSDGLYWSCDYVDSDLNWGLLFGSDGAGTGDDGGYIAHGKTVRCVAKEILK
jgi:uncharacterized protein (TIGR02145 family)